MVASHRREGWVRSVSVMRGTQGHCLLTGHSQVLGDHDVNLIVPDEHESQSEGWKCQGVLCREAAVFIVPCTVVGVRVLFSTAALFGPGGPGGSARISCWDRTSFPEAPGCPDLALAPLLVTTLGGSDLAPWVGREHFWGSALPIPHTPPPKAAHTRSVFMTLALSGMSVLSPPLPLF